MATILQFAERVADGQDWTASERAQLRDVGLQLDGMDVVFGQSEAGDPWCVVTDDGGDVLLHVARIGGDFVVHAAHQDEVVLDEDLWTAAKRILGDVLKERRGVLLAFGPEALGQTAVLAFLFAAAMRGEFDHWAPHTADDAPPPAEPPHASVIDTPETAAPQATPAEAADAHAPDAPVRGEATREAAPAVTLQAQAPAAAHDGEPYPKAEAQPPNAPPAPHPPQGAALPPVAAAQNAAQNAAHKEGGAQTTAAAFSAGHGGDGHAVAGEASASEAGGARSEATTRAASEPAPQAPMTDFVHGGGGDDRIAMGRAVAATGGGGADTFVLTLPDVPHVAPVLLGVVGDFHAAEGDRLELSGKAVVVVDRAEADLLAGLRTSASASEPPVMTGRHIGYDVDGDGHEDAYVLVTGTGGDWFTSSAHPVGGGGAATPTAGGTGLAPGYAPGAEGLHAPIGITGEPSHPPAGAEFDF